MTMEMQNKTDCKADQKLFLSYSKSIHGEKQLMGQEESPASKFSAPSTSSDKFDCSKYFMNKKSNVSFNVEIKDSESVDYDVVIKQFDELISELSNSGDSNDKCPSSSNLFDIVQGNFTKNNVKNLNESVSYSEKNKDNSASWIRISGNETDPANSKSMSSMQKDQCNDNSFLGTKGNIPWIDSNLWSFQNKKQPDQFQKSVSLVKKNIAADVLADSSKGMHLIFNQPVTGMFGPTDVLNPPAFCAVKIPKKRDMNNSVYAGIKQNDWGRFPHSEAYFKEMSLHNSNFQAFKTGGKVSLQSSHRTCRTPASKYVLPNNCFVVKLFIETKDLHLGPFPFEIYPKMSLRLLKLKVEQEHGIISSSQRWILGNNFAVDNDKSLVDYNVMPGSSIILYVNNDQRICYDASKNKFYGVRNGALTINKETKNNTKGKEWSAELESLPSKPKQMEARDLLNTNSIGFTPVHSFPKSDTECCVKSQNNEKLDIIKEQSVNPTSGGINPALGGEMCDKTKSPMIKRKNLKKSAEPKKKTKIKVPTISDKPSGNYREKLYFDEPKSNFNNHDAFLQEEKSSTGNLFSSVDSKATYENKSEQSQEETPEDVLNSFQTNNSNTLIPNYQPNSLAESAFTSFHSSAGCSVEDTKLTETFKGVPLRFVLDHNLPDSSYSTFSLEVFKECSGECKNGKEDTDKISASFNIAEMHNNIRDEFLAMEPSLNPSTVKEIVRDLHAETLAGSITSNEQKKNKEINLNNLFANRSDEPEFHKNIRDEYLAIEPLNQNPATVNISREKEIIQKISSNEQIKNEEKDVNDLSANIPGKCQVEDILPAKEPENLILSNTSCSEEVEKVQNSHNNIIPSQSNILQQKRSVTSLIRKLSLTRKAKSVDDSSCWNTISSNKFYDERTGEKASKQSTSISDQSTYSDIHIEILPQNSDPFPIKDENTEQCEDKTPLEDHTVHNTETVKNFELLLEIESMDLVENPTNFICPVCFDEFESGQGVILHDCLHVFCRICLANSICYAEGALVKCPYRDDFYSCQSHLQQREIKALVSEDAYERYLQRSIITAEGSEERSFHCKTPDCPGWCIYDIAINVFHCPVCFHYNCLNCQAIHEGLNCRQYQDKLKLQQKVDQDAQKTLELLNKMIEGGKALRCPKCDLILMKKWGCDWLKCSICQTEICWITKGPRWGPGGQGDTSGGCRCGVNGVKCHPSCTYCH